MKACSEKAPAAGSMGGNLRQPIEARRREAALSAGARRRRHRRRLRLRGAIGTDGTVSDLQTTSGANPDLELAAANAIRQWEFTPTLLNCVAVEVPMTITVSFKPAQ